MHRRAAAAGAAVQEHRRLALRVAAHFPIDLVTVAGLQPVSYTHLDVYKRQQHGRKTGKKKVLVVSADVYRPAAIDQLKSVAAQVGVDFLPSDPSQKPEDIARNAVAHARRHHYDVLILDTAGRLGIDEAMMREIRALHDLVKPIETLFVVDAMQGQDAVNTARAFAEALPLTGVVLTKMCIRDSPWVDHGSRSARFQPQALLPGLSWGIWGPADRAGRARFFKPGWRPE